jgi:hypothetical protein
MRALAIIVIILGLAALVFGIVFLPQASSGEKEIADSVAPLTLDQVSPKYDAVTAKFDEQRAKEEPAIQAGQAAPSALYAYYAGQRALLGLAKSNMGVASFVRMLGIANIIIGLGLIGTGFLLFRKKSAA